MTDNYFECFCETKSAVKKFTPIGLSDTPRSQTNESEVDNSLNTSDQIQKNSKMKIAICLLLILAIVTNAVTDLSDESEYDSDITSTDTDDSVEDSDSTIESLEGCSECNIPMNGGYWKSAYKTMSHWSTEDGKPVLVLQPKPCLAGQTRSALYFSKQTAKDFILEAECKTGASTRKDNVGVNHWEVFWLVFNAKAERRHEGYSMFTKTWNTLMLKPNGWQVSTGYQIYGEDFLGSGQEMYLRRNRFYKYMVKKVGTTVTVGVKDIDVTKVKFEKTFKKHSWEQHGRYFFDQEGMIGLYSEDAVVTCRSVRLKSLD